MAGDRIVPVEHLILTVRGQRVILSSDLAGIYGVETRTLNQAVKRNADRFPPDFAFRLTSDEAMEAQRSRSQSVMLKRGQNIKYLPLAFTEHGAIMAATVLNSPRAVQMSIFVARVPATARVGRRPGGALGAARAVGAPRRRARSRAKGRHNNRIPTPILTSDITL